MRALFALALALSACGDKENPENPEDTQSEPQDADGDGLLAAEDCDDGDPTLGGDELPYDGIDNDCDPLTLDDDLDGDGFALAEDCDDGDPHWVATSSLTTGRQRLRSPHA
ncbi:MAG: hypothetical protein IPN01_32290 [Deltaproteobacteria bacterium]|nr:hypothetical protein [Deltaproteobacteria bacterium]